MAACFGFSDEPAKGIEGRLDRISSNHSMWDTFSPAA